MKDEEIKSEPLIAMMTLIFLIKYRDAPRFVLFLPSPACVRGVGGEGKIISNIEFSIPNFQGFSLQTTDKF